MQGDSASLPRSEALEYLEQAYVSEEQGEFRRSLEECDTAIQTDPSLADAHNLRGVVLEELGRPEEAIAAYKRAIQLDPGFSEAKGNLSDLAGEMLAEGRLVWPVLTPSQEKGRGSPPSVQEVVERLSELDNPRRPTWTGILYFAISLLLFVGLGLMSNPVIDLAILVAVILIHEIGHYVAMTLFGYGDVRVFLIPMFGAAVSGKAPRASATKEAIVALAGPLPGILLGTVAGAITLSVDSPLLLQLALMLVIINGLNLLPVFPFDGGVNVRPVMVHRCSAKMVHFERWRWFTPCVSRVIGWVGRRLLDGRCAPPPPGGEGGGS